MNIKKYFSFILLKIIVKITRKYEHYKDINRCNKDFEKLKLYKDKIMNISDKGYKIKAEESNLFTNNDIMKIYTGDYYIGEIDQDGFVLANVDEIKGVPNITSDEFMKRERFGVSLMVKNGYLAVEKHYKRNKLAFVKEIKALHMAAEAGCNVPQILDIDFESLTLTLSYIQGKVLREELAKKGAEIRDSQVGKNSEFSYFKRIKVSNKRIKEGKKRLFEVVNHNFVEDVFTQYTKLHDFGIVNNDIKYGNIIIEENSNKPYLIDFETTWLFSKQKGFKCRVLAKHDMIVLKKHFK